MTAEGSRIECHYESNFRSTIAATIEPDCETIAKRTHSDNVPIVLRTVCLDGSAESFDCDFHFHFHFIIVLILVSIAHHLYNDRHWMTWHYSVSKVSCKIFDDTARVHEFICANFPPKMPIDRIQLKSKKESELKCASPIFVELSLSW